jgi:ketosteroid isomerase-like protein
MGMAAFNSGDLDRFIAVWPADDIIVMMPGIPPIFGRAALRTFLEQAFVSVRIEETAEAEEQVIAGEWAFERLAISESVVPRTGGETVHREGKALDVYRRQADGSWKVARSILNYNSG